eukprot:2432226-Pleurochrysis_carterae.AAC.1
MANAAQLATIRKIRNALGVLQFGDEEHVPDAASELVSLVSGDEAAVNTVIDLDGAVPIRDVLTTTKDART